MGQKKGKGSGSSSTDDRSMNWTFTLFTASLDDGWLDRLRSTLIPTLVSPEHDGDINPDGTNKLPHYHVQFAYDSKKSADQVWEDALSIGLNAIGGSSFKESFTEWEIADIRKTVTRNRRELYNAYDADGNCYGQIQKVRNRNGLTRYLIHQDNPEKMQYDSSKIIRYCIDEDTLTDWLGGTYNKYQVIREMKKFCRENEVIYFSDLCDYAEENHPDTWEKALDDCAAYIMDRYIKALNYKMRNSDKQRYNEQYKKYCEKYRELDEYLIKLKEDYGVI